MRRIPIYLEMLSRKVPKPCLVSERIALRYNLKRGDTVTGPLAVQVDTDVFNEEMFGIELERDTKKEGSDDH